MPYVPPWLDVSPRDFIAAAQGGAKIGAELAGQATEAGIASGRNATALQEAQMRENTAMSGQQAESSLAQARLDQAAKQQQAEQLLRQWEVEQQIKRQQDTVAAENQRAAAALAERQQYGNSMLDIRREANRISQQKADTAENKPSPQDFVTQSSHTPGVSPHEEYTIKEPGTPPGSNFNPLNWFRANKGIPPSSLTTTNSNDLLGLPPGATISTNKIPGAPSITTTRRIPLLSTQPNAQPQTPQQSQRVAVQDQNGKKFTIPEEQLQDALDMGYSEVQ
jgi:hypothetical protein